MSRILVIHHSRDGQAARIGSRIARVLEACGNRVEVLPATTPSLTADIDENDAIVVGAGVRFGRHGGEFERTLRRHREGLAHKPNAFYSVSMAMAGDEPKREEARRYADGLIARTGWHPDRTVLFAGALRYTAYNPFVRWMMRKIAEHTGRATDTTCDHEYTDWAEVDRFARDFAARMALGGAAQGVARASEAAKERALRELGEHQVAAD